MILVFSLSLNLCMDYPRSNRWASPERPHKIFTFSDLTSAIPFSLFWTSEGQLEETYISGCVLRNSFVKAKNSASGLTVFSMVLVIISFSKSTCFWIFLVLLGIGFSAKHNADIKRTNGIIHVLKLKQNHDGLGYWLPCLWLLSFEDWCI